MRVRARRERIVVMIAMTVMTSECRTWECRCGRCGWRLVDVDVRDFFHDRDISSLYVFSFLVLVIPLQGSSLFLIAGCSGVRGAWSAVNEVVLLAASLRRQRARSSGQIASLIVDSMSCPRCHIPVLVRLTVTMNSPTSPWALTGRSCSLKMTLKKCVEMDTR